MKKTSKDTPEITLARTVVPKPTKAEVISAMAQLQHAKMRAETKSIQEKKDALLREITSEVSDYVVANIVELKRSIRAEVFSWSRPRAEIDLLDLPSGTQKKIAAHKAMQVPNVPDVSDIQRQIRARMLNETTDERVAKLVSDPASKAALEEMLATLSRPGVPALADARR